MNKLRKDLCAGELVC